MKYIFFISLLSMFLLTACGPSGPGAYDSFAQCISDAGLTMYGTEWCPHCKDQKAAFEGSFGSVSYVDCDQQKAVCSNEGITGYPTWKLNGEAFAGKRDLQFFADLTGCPLE